MIQESQTKNLRKMMKKGRQQRVIYVLAVLFLVVFVARYSVSIFQKQRLDQLVDLSTTFAKVGSRLNLGQLERDAQELPEQTSFISDKNFFEPELFFQAVARTAPKQGSSQLSAKGIVVPHHLLASELIADGISYFDPNAVKTVILISPNHFETGVGLIQTSYTNWQTPLGMMQADRVAILALEELLSSQTTTFFEVSHQTLENDHGVAGLIPFLVQYLPQAKLVPITIKAKPSIEQIDQLINAFGQLFFEGIIKTEQTIIIGSVDFSHELLPYQAQENDKITRKLLEDRNWEALLKLGNEHLDSPASVILTYRLASLLGANNIEILENTNSGKMLGIYDKGCTSYFEAVFN